MAASRRKKRRPKKGRPTGRPTVRYQWRDIDTGLFVSAAVGASDALAYERIAIEQHRGDKGQFVPKPRPKKPRKRKPTKPKPKPTKPPKRPPIPPPPEPPPGVTPPREVDFELTTSAEAARRNMQRAFEEAIRRLGMEANAKMRTSINADGTVDGELAIYDISEGEKEDIVGELQSAMEVVPNTWISLVWQLASQTKEDLADLRKRYAEFKKQFFAGTHYSRSEVSKWADRFATAMDVLDMLKTAGRSVGGLLLRLYWSPTDKKPQRFAGKPTKTRGRRRRGPMVPIPTKLKRKTRKTTRKTRKARTARRKKAKR